MSTDLRNSVMKNIHHWALSSVEKVHIDNHNPLPTEVTNLLLMNQSELHLRPKKIRYFSRFHRTHTT